MKPNDKAYREFMRVYNKTHVSLEAQIMASLTAAYAAQFPPSEDYAGLVKEMRERAGSYDIQDWHREIELKAADAIEALLAERDEWRRQAEICRDKLQETEIALGECAQERDALKVENESMRQSLPLWAHKQMAANNELIESLRAERDAIAARLAPVEDYNLEILAAKEYIEATTDMPPRTTYTISRRSLSGARAAIAAIRPHIEAAERERCAKIADKHEHVWHSELAHPCARAIAAAIRSEK